MSRRGTVLVGLGLCVAAAQPSFGTTTIPVPGSPTALVAFSAAGKVFVVGGSPTTQFSQIDPATNSVTKSVGVMPSATSLATDPVFGTVFEAGGAPVNGQYYIDNVAVMFGGPQDSLPAVSWIIPMESGIAPTIIGYNSVTQHLYVASATDQALHILDASEIGSGNAPKWLPKVPLGHMPTDIGIDEPENYVDVATADGNVIAYDGANQHLYDPTKVGNSAAHIVVNPASAQDDPLLKGKIFVSTDSGVAVLTVGSTDPPTQIALPGQVPGALALNGVTGSLFVADLAHNAVTVIDAHKGVASPVQVQVGMHPSAVSVLTSSGNLIAGDNEVFVANAGDNTVSEFMDPALGTNLITLPVRWCAVEGSPAAGMTTVPSGAGVPYTAGNASTDATLLALLRQATSEVWINQAQIAFRAANSVHIPIIADPDPPQSGTEHLGDVSIDNFFSDVAQATQECEMAWQHFDPTQKGIIAVNVRQFLGGGSTNSTEGTTPAPTGLVWGEAQSSKLCSFPRTLSPSDVTGLDVAVIDAENYGYKDVNGIPGYFGVGSGALTLAHELGHALLLGHGDGIDNDQNGTLPPMSGARRYDGYCDKTYGSGTDTQYSGTDDQCHTINTIADALIPIEDNESCLSNFVAAKSCGSIMIPGATCPALQSLQIETARDAAHVEPGAVFSGSMDPSGSLVASTWCRKPGCGAPRDQALTKVDIDKPPNEERADISVSASGLIGSGQKRRYVVLFDTDDNASTGCAVNPWGIPTILPGAELAIVIDANGLKNQVETRAQVWQCHGGTFELAPLQPTDTHAVSAVVGRGPSRAGTRITVSLPANLGQMLAESTRVAAFSPVSHGAVQRSRVIPRLGPIIVSLLPPVLPTCTVSPQLVKAGGGASIHIGGWSPSTAVTLYLANSEVATGQTNAAGDLDQAVIIPAGLSGLAQVSVVEKDTSLTAVCAISVEGPLPVLGPHAIAQLAGRLRFPAGVPKVGVLLDYQLAMRSLVLRPDASVALRLEFDSRVLRLEKSSLTPSRKSTTQVDWDRLSLATNGRREGNANPPGINISFRVLSCPAHGETAITAVAEDAADEGSKGGYLPVREIRPVRIACESLH